MSASNSEQVTLPTSPPEGVTLRIMKASDLPQVRELHRNLLPVFYPAAFFIQLLINQRRLCLVATEGDVIVGFASAAIGPLKPDSVEGPDRDDALSHNHPSSGSSGSDIPYSQVTLLTLGVLPPYQRRGIGRSLVHGVIQRLEASCNAGESIHHTSSDHTANQDNKTAVLVQVQVATSNFAGKCFYTHLGMMDQRFSDDPRLHFGLRSRTSVMAGVLCV